MGVICAGCIWLIFAPSADEKAKQEQTVGFNTDIPLPKNETIIDDKASAYEQEQMKQKQAERMRSLEDFSSLLGSDNPKQTDGLTLLTDEPQATKTGGKAKPTPMQNSVNAYRDINRTLGNFYETPKSDPEKEELKKQIEELQARMNETENRKNTVDEQMALMEKSFQMAFKYIPMSQGTSISLSNNAGKQLVADMGHSVIQGISQFSSKKTHKAKVYLKVFYHVFLLPEGNMNNLQLVNN